jgi:indolepyruvate ferredoxin oxidoreductase
VDEAGLDGALRRLLETRTADLHGYQGPRYAREYVEDVLEVLAAERGRIPAGAPAVTEAYARGLHKLMAYKDEYEVARLHLDALEQARRTEAFGAGARAEVLLHPPLLRAMGLDRKVRLRRSAVPLFRVLRVGRRLRGTPLDPFGRTSMRRLERELVDDYRRLVRGAVEHLSPRTHDEVAAIAALPDMVRGYEQIKLDNVERYRAAAREALSRLTAEAPVQA